jgi:hypothetical protein
MPQTADQPTQEPRQPEDISAPVRATPAPTSAWGRVRSVALAALIVCIVVTSLCSVVLATSASHPNAPAAILNPDVVPGEAADVLVGTQRAATPTPCACAVQTRQMEIGPMPDIGMPTYSGRLILISLSQQWLWAFQNQRMLFSSPVTTGRPQLPTPTGVFSITQKVTDTTFISPWGPGSPYYYSPEHVNYAMLFLTGGYFIHDAPWRYDFGPGTNVPHVLGNGQTETGSHGCVEMPTKTAAWLFNWTGYGTRVWIVN